MGQSSSCCDCGGNVTSPAVDAVTQSHRFHRASLELHLFSCLMNSKKNTRRPSAPHAVGYAQAQRRVHRCSELILQYFDMPSLEHQPAEILQTGARLTRSTGMPETSANADDPANVRLCYLLTYLLILLARSRNGGNSVKNS